jgi:hypothetical protein
VRIVRWEEGHYDTYGQPRHLTHPGGSQLAFDELVRDSRHHSGAVARAVGGLGAAMVQIVEALEAETDDVVARRTVAGAYESNAAGVAHVGEVVQREGIVSPVV